jgi:hypothetical protein
VILCNGCGMLAADWQPDLTLTRAKRGRCDSCGYHGKGSRWVTADNQPLLDRLQYATRDLSR